VDGRVRVIDFDDCGYVPVEFEVGNTLYMVLFDASMSSRMQRYERFRTWFVDEYRSASGREVTDAMLDRAIRLRVGALGHWIDRPETAPIGIRTSTPEWGESLRTFVRSTTDD
jgi:Ser/Thr protein kinase RdoA (MazF antagonist)